MTDTPSPLPAASPAPATPAGPPPVRAPRSVAQGVWRIVVGVALIGTGIGSQVAGVGFPGNAPVEMFMNFGISVTAFTAGVVLIAFGILASTRASVSLTARSVSPLALIAAILAIVSALWAAVALPAQLADVAATADRLRYMSLSAPAFFSGFLWSTGIVMGAISLRSPSVLSKVLSIAAVVLGFAVIATNIWAAAIYSAGLTD